MLEENLKNQLKGYLDRLVQPVEIVASLDDGDKSREMLELLQDIVSLSPLVTLDPARDAAQVKPSFALRRPGQEPHVRFAGLPMGHEFTSLVLALLQAGGHPSKALPAVLEQIRGLEGELNFETFVSLSCQSCPDVVQALNLMAVVNPKIRHTMIDGALFQDEVERREVMAVPSRIPERQALRPGPYGAPGNPLQARRRRPGTRLGDVQCESALRRAGRRRRARRRGGRHLCGAQGNSHRHCRRAPGRTVVGYRGHREFHFREGNRGPQAGDRT